MEVVLYRPPLDIRFTAGTVQYSEYSEYSGYIVHE